MNATPKPDPVFHLLPDRPDAIPVLAAWFFEQWGRHVEGTTLETEIAKVSTYQGRDGAPLMVVATVGGEDGGGEDGDADTGDADAFVGAAALKVREMSIFPQYEHWLGNVYVAPARRGQGLASKLVREVVERARRAGVERLYLQTESLDGGLYGRLGFQPVEQVRYRGQEVLVMELPLT